MRMNVMNVKQNYSYISFKFNSLTVLFAFKLNSNLNLNFVRVDVDVIVLHLHGIIKQLLCHNSYSYVYSAVLGIRVNIAQRFDYMRHANFIIHRRVRKQNGTNLQMSCVFVCRTWLPHNLDNILVNCVSTFHAMNFHNNYFVFVLCL